MSYNERKNYLTGNILSDEWFTPENVVSFIYENFSVNNKKIICPFDSEKSEFTKKFPNSINSIKDFMEKDYDYDICITNPPFSLKEKVVEKILKDNKEAILVLPQTFLYSTTFYDLVKKYKFFYDVYIPRTRIYFYDEKGNQNRPNFHSVIVHIKNNVLEYGKNKYIDLEKYKGLEKE